VTDEGRAADPFVFALGHVRSGTTMLRAMFDSHPALAVPPESYFVTTLLGDVGPWDSEAFVATLGTDKYFADWQLEPAEVGDVLAADPRVRTNADAVAGLYRHYARRAGKPRYGDKTPSHLLHVPLLVRAPGIEPRRVRDTEAGLIDLAPTLLDLLDSEPSLPHLDGASLVPAMLGQTLRHIVFARDTAYEAAFSANYKLVLDRPEGRYHLYDLEGDYAEETSLFGLPGHDGIARDLYYAYQAGAIGPWGKPGL